MGTRTSRELENREQESRAYVYRPSNQLPDPDPQDGYTYRWIRTAFMGQSDARNVSMARREGYEPVKVEDHPELMLDVDADSKSGNVEIGGLMLCKIPTEKAQARQAYYESKANQQVKSGDNAFMRENDPRMPLFSEKRSEVVFGKQRQTT